MPPLVEYCQLATLTFRETAKKIFFMAVLLRLEGGTFLELLKKFRKPLSSSEAPLNGTAIKKNFFSMASLTSVSGFTLVSFQPIFLVGPGVRGVEARVHQSHRERDERQARARPRHASPLNLYKV